MIITNLQLRDFRNYHQVEVDFASGVTIIVGLNGQGKTNLVEAIAFLSSGSSHRVSTDQALVRTGTEFAQISGTVRHGDRQVRVDWQINRTGSNRMSVNGNPVRSKQAQRYVDTVLFAPEDLNLVKGEPAVRRKILDNLVATTTPRLGAVLADYDRVLRQRNALLKSARFSRNTGDSMATLDVWDERLVAIGSQVTVARIDLIKAIEPRWESAYQRIAGSNHSVRLRLSVSTGSESAEVEEATVMNSSAAEVAHLLRKNLAEVRAKELERGLSLVGPHRDDLVIELNGLPTRGYASHGESWSTALALRIASAELLRDTGPAGDPIVILDDVFAELDAARRARLLQAVSEFEQVIITAAVESDIPELEESRLLRVEAGKIVDG